MSDEQASEKKTATGLFVPETALQSHLLPAALHTRTRSGVAQVDPLLADVEVVARHDLQGSVRGVDLAATMKRVQPPLDSVLALEAEDGTTIFIHADRLGEDLQRLQPEALREGGIDLSLFRSRDAGTRGFSDVLWKAVSILRLPNDGLAEEAVSLAKQWAIDRLRAGSVNRVYDGASFLGAKALMWVIESRLAGRPGLYLWQERTIAAEDRCLADDVRLEKARRGAPMLLLIHGTASYTVGGFSDLRADDMSWNALRAQFPGGIFGYEHRTFSQSPQENALKLLEQLPAGARVSIVTHSRGGLVGDLLCLRPDGDYADAIAAYRIPVSSNEPAAADLENEAAEERQRLRQVIDLLGQKKITVERYVRVASPARGTRFLSDNLDVALSDFLNLLQWGGGALVGAIGAAFGGPVAGDSAGQAASSAIGVLKRLVLEIAARRIDPRMIPGIAAMRIDSPLAAFLAHPDSSRREGLQMAVIAGDTEFTGFGFSHLGRRVANLFCDWRLFDDRDNDLVVDTDSMYAGLGFKPGAYYLYDQGERVTHFRYFANPLTRDALRDWLVKETAMLSQLDNFLPLTPASRPVATASSRSRGLSGSQPRVIILPGIMGSYLAVDHPARAERVWFDFFELAKGKLERIAPLDDQSIIANEIWPRFYGDLAAYLAGSHEVIACPYDWRQRIEDCVETLKKAIEDAHTENPKLPIRLLAHSMGGLVARALIAQYSSTWQKVIDSGGCLVMLGTPNNGADLMVHTLLGKTSSMRGLEKLDFKHDLQAILDMVAGFPGALTLLPRPPLAEADSQAVDYYQRTTWEELKKHNTDRWYGAQVAALPADTLLADARSFWAKVLPKNEISHPERVSYVFGQGDKTPCGVVKTDDGRLQLQFTLQGDGSVTWASGRLANLSENERCWYMPVEHADLTGEAKYFPAILDLLTSGHTRQLERLPRQRGLSDKPFVLEAPPPILPGEGELARAIFGSGARQRKRTRKASLSVTVHAGDLRFIDQPLICGHYIGDPIAAAEADLDARLQGRLSERERLGVYAGPIGSSAIILPSLSSGQIDRDSRPGAIVVGLGDFNGQLSAHQLTETVRAGVLRLLLLLRDASTAKDDQSIHLYSLLIGCNSTLQISISESVAAITCGVLEANRQFSQAVDLASGCQLTVAALTFIDLYRDMAISAARAVLALPQSLASRLKSLNAHLEVAGSLQRGKGVRERLSAEQALGYWSRLIVTDADKPTGECPDAADETDPAPPTASGDSQMPPAQATPKRSASGTTRLPTALKYVFLSQRARAETRFQQSQPGLIETIVHKQSALPRHDPQLAKLLFQLLIPLEYKVLARELPRLLLILDSYTASLPWELLQADDEPLAVRMPVIRQLISDRFRASVPTAGRNSACLIVSPSTQGLARRFVDVADSLPKLPGAVAEGEALRATLSAADWNDIVYCREESDFLEVFNHLYRQPYRLLVICAHGIFETTAKDGRAYSGAVLSDGMLITAVEIGAMEVVPEIVFLNCCYQAGMNSLRRPNRLAYSLARELIDIGVRCVVVAGWAIDDDAAKTFSCTFMEHMTSGTKFGEAIFAARRTTYEQHPGSNTWGAYQAYGDPGYRLRADLKADTHQGASYVAVEELLDSLETRHIGFGQSAAATRTSFADEQIWVGKHLAYCPDDWRRRPQVQQALAVLYKACGSNGFAAARAAYLAALQGEESLDDARVTCRAAEQLANLEARDGETLVRRGDVEAGLQLIDSAIARLQALGRLSAAVDGAVPQHGERLALLGSALKRKAVMMARAKNKHDWRKKIAPVLDQAAEAYFKGGAEGSPARPYATLNALQLDWLAGKRLFAGVSGTALARQCGIEAKRLFNRQLSFWDAAAGVDALLVEYLLAGGEIGASLEGEYRQLAKDVAHDPGSWDSLRSQFEQMATLLEKRAGEGDGARVELLKRLASLPTTG